MASITQMFPGVALNQVQTIPFQVSFSAAPSGLTTYFNFDQTKDFFVSEISKLMYIESLSVTANLPDDMFSIALDRVHNNGLFSVMLRPINTNGRITKYPIPFQRLSSQFFVNAFWENPMLNRTSERNQNGVRVELLGRLQQIPEIIEYGVDEIILVVSGVAYAISDQQWVNENLFIQKTRLKNGLV